MEKETKLNRALMDADGFLFAANFLRDAIFANYLGLVVYGPAYTANLAFACELYLKQLLILEDNEQRGHKLKDLYNCLSADSKDFISAEYVKRCNDFKEKHDVTLSSFEDCLENYNTAFEDWRYWYEGNKNSKMMGWYDFHILIEILREMVCSYGE